MVYQSSSSARTKAFGARIAAGLVALGLGRSARVLALSGELGSGKTTFVQGFARGLGARGRATSPTFILMRRMPIARGAFANLFHLDAYRLRSRADLRALGIREILREPRNVVLVEWPERVSGGLPRGALRVRFEHGAKRSTRTIRISDKFFHDKI